MSKLSESQIYSLLVQGGFTHSQATTMAAIAEAESGGNPGAVGDVSLENGTWGPSVGLFQVRTLKSETGTGSDRDIQHLTGNPAAQVKAALHISNGGHNFHPWSTFTSGSYKQYLRNDLVAGDVPASSTSGASGTTATLAAHDTTTAAAATDTTTADPYAMGKGAQPSAADGDHDGLTDQFEALLGTNPNSADTDHDGLSDAYETTVSHTDPLNADTNHDGITDGMEISRGLDPGHATLPAAAQAAGFGGLATQDSDHDGLSDAYEKQIGTNPLLADSDHDGIPDGVEVARGTNPLLLDSNHDGITDGFAAQHDLFDPTAAGSTLGTGAGLGTGTGLTTGVDTLTTGTATDPLHTTDVTHTVDGATH